MLGYRSLYITCTTPQWVVLQNSMWIEFSHTVLRVRILAIADLKALNLYFVFLCRLRRAECDGVFVAGDVWSQLRLYIITLILLVVTTHRSASHRRQPRLQCLPSYCQSARLRTDTGHLPLRPAALAAALCLQLVTGDVFNCLNQT